MTTELAPRRDDPARGRRPGLAAVTVSRAMRCADMDEQEHSASPESLDPQAPAVTSPITAPAAQQAKRHRRADTVRKALISRGAGWVVAAALAVAVVVLSVSLATASTATGVRSLGAAGPACLGPAGVGPARLLVPAGLRVQVPARLLVPPHLLVPSRQLVPAGLLVPVPSRLLVPAGLRVPVPSRLLIPPHVLVPAGLRVRSCAT